MLQSDCFAKLNGWTLIQKKYKDLDLHIKTFGL